VRAAIDLPQASGAPPAASIRDRGYPGAQVGLAPAVARWYIAGGMLIHTQACRWRDPLPRRQGTQADSARPAVSRGESAKTNPGPGTSIRPTEEPPPAWSRGPFAEVPPGLPQRDSPFGHASVRSRGSRARRAGGRGGRRPAWGPRLTFQGAGGRSPAGGTGYGGVLFRAAHSATGAEFPGEKGALLSSAE